MAHLPLSEEVFDRSEYDRARKQLRFVGRALPEDSVSMLAQEVVKRLAFRIPKSQEAIKAPDALEIEELCAALLSSEEHAGERIILSARREGVDTKELYLGYITGAARRLGEMWEDDSASFIEVTMASGRLYRIIRGLRHALAAGISDGREDCPVFFALVPQETHTLGIEIATDLFRREGWDVDMALDMDHDELVERSESRNYKAIVLVANSDQMMEPLTRLIVALRITQPLAHIVVAGNILNHHPRIADITGVDAVIDQIDTAVVTLRDMIVVDDNV